MGILFTPAEDGARGPTPVQIEFEHDSEIDASQVDGAVEDDTSKEELPPAPINVEVILHEMGTKILLTEFESILDATDGTTLTGVSDKEEKFHFEVSLIGIEQQQLIFTSRLSIRIQVF